MHPSPIVNRLARFAYSLTGFAVLVFLAAIHWPLLHPAVWYAGAFITSSLLFLLFAFLTSIADISGRHMALFLAMALLLRLSFLGTTPIGSDDIYRYQWDGRVQDAGINPYRFAPGAPELSGLQSAQLPSSVNHPDLKTLYFPVTEWAFYLCYQFSGESVWAYKVMLFLAEVAAIIALFLLLTRLGISAKYILLYALCPLTITQFSIDAHVDALGLPFLALGLWMYLGDRKITALVMLALAISVKPVALVVLPVLFFAERGTIAKARVVLIPALVVLAQYAPYMFGVNPFEGLFTFTKHWTFNGAVFSLLNLFILDNQIARIVSAILLAGLLLFLYSGGRSFMEKVYVAILLLLLFSPVVHPWYITWLALLVPAVRRWSGVVYVSAASLASITAAHYALTGSWQEYPEVLLAEYVPVAVLLLLEMRPRRNDTIAVAS